MPQVLALIPLVIGAVGAGEGIASLVNRPSAPKVPTAPPPGVTAIQRDQQVNAEKAAISQQSPNVVAATSGLANPEYVAQISQLLSGTAGQPGARGAANAIIRQIFGLGPTAGPGPLPAGTQGTNFTPASATTASVAPTADTTGISDFVRQFV